MRFSYKDIRYLIKGGLEYIIIKIEKDLTIIHRLLGYVLIILRSIKLYFIRSYIMKKFLLILILIVMPY